MNFEPCGFTATRKALINALRVAAAKGRLLRCGFVVDE